MLMTATFCRDQEHAQRVRAAGSTLANIREVAERAALAWAAEAALADAREARRERLAGGPSRPQGPGELADNENPDRGMVDA